MEKNNKVVLVAGGTGGHINASLALGDELHQRGYECTYFSGKRYLDYQLYKGKNCRHLDVSPLRFKNPFKLLKGILVNIIASLKLINYFLKNRPKFVVGAGGYVCGPTLAVAFFLRVPVYIIEQNAVMGLTNKLLGNISKKIFVHFKNTRGTHPNQSKKIVVSGNPTRNIMRVDSAKKNSEKNETNILVFGGSLGATQINDAISILASQYFDFPLSIRHQVGKSKDADPKNISSNISYQKYEYIDDMEKFYEWADVIVARAGASTISELRGVQKPVALIPYPQATDNHQVFNALELKNEAHFPVLVLNNKNGPEELAKEIHDFIVKIKNENLSYEIKPIENSSQKIIKEIEKDVWT